MTVPSGGSATIHGIFYQMLWSLLQASVLHIKNCDCNETGVACSRASLILEPIGGGGDLLIQSPQLDVIQQLKAKSGEGSWALMSVVNEVIPDLYKGAVLNRSQRFDLVTEGHLGNWLEVYQFFRVLHTRNGGEVPENVWDHLSETQILKFHGAVIPGSGDRGTRSLSERALFKEIADRLASLLLNAVERQSASHRAVMERKLWKVLANFEFQGNQQWNDVERQCLTFLEPLVSDSARVRATLDSLLLSLVREARKGSAAINSADFFRQHGLDGLRLTAWPAILRSGREALDASLAGARYRSGDDVRPASENLLNDWHPSGRRFLLLTGESGQGKTWLLCSLARHVATTAPPLFVTATGDARQDVEKAGAILWQVVLRRDGAESLVRTATRLRQSIPSLAAERPTVYLFVDNIRSEQEARELFEALVHAPDVCVAFSAPPDVAESVARYAAENTLLYPVPNFTDTELEHYVAGGDPGRWHDIPEDVRAVISRPLLAGLYRELTADGLWRAATEYSLFARFYRQRLVEPITARARTALVPLRRLALTVWLGASYPCTLEQLVDFGFSDLLLDHLIELGWFVRYDDDHRYGVWHDRLLNWQIAEALAEGLRAGTLDPEEVGQRSREQLWERWHRPSGELRLDYVPMDLVWLLAQKRGTMAEQLDTILAHLDNGYHTHRGLYGSLLPGIGDEIAPALLRRIERTSGDDAGRSIMAIVDALFGLEHAEIPVQGMRFLTSPSWRVRRAGITLLSSHPTAEALDSLWERYQLLYQNRSQGYEIHDNEPPDYRWEMSDLRRALRACVREVPDWPEKQLSESDPTRDLISTLLYLLRYVQGGSDGWHRQKARLMGAFSPETVTPLAQAVAHFGDLDEVGWVEERLNDPVSATSYGELFKALVRIAPETAITSLERHLVEGLFRRSGYAVRQLLVRKPIEGRQICDQLIQKWLQNQPEAAWELANLAAGVPGALSDATFDCLLDDLLPRFAAGSAAMLHSSLVVLERVRELRLLHRLWARAGTEWENGITEILVQRGPHPAWGNQPALQTALNVLYRVAGKGFTHVLNLWLASQNDAARYRALGLVPKRPNEETFQHLQALALSDTTADEDYSHDSNGIDEGSGTTSSDQNQDRAKRAAEQQRQNAEGAATALAQAGAWDFLVPVIINNPDVIDHDEVILARAQLAPLSEEVIRPAIERLSVEPSDPGALLVIGFSRRAEHLPLIIKALADDTETNALSTTAEACLLALQMIGEVPDEAVPPLLARLHTGDDQALVLAVLREAKSDVAARGLLDLVRGTLLRPLVAPYSMKMVGQVVETAVMLLSHPATSDETVTLCSNRVLGNDGKDTLTQALLQRFATEVIEREATEQVAAFRAVLDCEPARRYLSDESFKKEDSGRIVGRKSDVISSFAVLKPDAAYRASVRVLRDLHGHDREKMPSLLMQLDSRQAIIHLTEFLEEGDYNERLRTSIARALCSHVDGLAWLIQATSQEANPVRRRIAAFALRFVEPTSAEISAEVELGLRTCLEAEDALVYDEAISSILIQGEQRAAVELSEAFRNELDISKRWVLLDATLDAADLGGTGQDAPNWLEKMMEGVMPIMVEHAEARIAKKREREARDLEKRERDLANA